MDEMYRASTMSIVSNHHQAAEPGEGLGEGLRVAAWSVDGVVEAIEAVDRDAYPFVFGTQFHPEAQFETDLHDGLWRALAEACRDYRAAHPERSVLPILDSDLGACETEDGVGICLPTDACAAGGGAASDGSCGDSPDVACCSDFACDAGDNLDGVCVGRVHCQGAGGAALAGGCPGDGAVTCCVREVGCRLREGQPGQCMDVGYCDAMGGHREAGHCPGPRDVQCCAIRR